MLSIARAELLSIISFISATARAWGGFERARGVCMYMCVCLCICVHAYTCIHCAYVHSFWAHGGGGPHNIHEHTYVCFHMHVCARTRTHASTYTYTHMHAHTYTCKHTTVHVLCVLTHALAAPSVFAFVRTSVDFFVTLCEWCGDGRSATFNCRAWSVRVRVGECVSV